MASMLKELVTIATKVATDGAIKGKGVLKELVTGAAAGIAGEVSENAAKKIGLLRENRYGELVLKLPVLKSTEDKIAKAFDAHPERQKVCFHFTDSIRDGVAFYDPEGKEAFTIKKDDKNLKKIDLYKGERFSGRIEKVVTINLNPLSDLQRYSVFINGCNIGMLRVEGLNVRPDYASWRIRHVVI